MSKLSRRTLLGRAGAAAGAALAFPAVVPGRALGAEDVAAASERLQIGLVGCGDLGRSGHHLGRMLGTKDVEIKAVCDVDADHRADAKKQTDARYGNTNCKEYLDFREVMDRKDLDAVIIVTPDHWHALVAIAAAEAGKDVYCEKPLSLTIAEGRAMVTAARRYGRVFQTGSQQRSDTLFHKACQAVRNGRVGKLKTIEARIGGGPVCDWEEPTDPPAGLDWNFWLGPARWVPYQKNRCHYQFRWIYDYSGGKMTDWGAHHNDIAQWGLGMDGSGPIAVTASGVKPSGKPNSYNCHPHFAVTYVYGNGARLVTTSDGENGNRFIGDRGWIFVNRERIEASDPKLLEEPLPRDAIRLYESNDHMGNFMDCIRSRKRCICGDDSRAKARAARLRAENLHGSGAH